ncbi:MAG TPA: hypothetical protein VKD24_07480, partial [Candidatus Angelobacter sp.]|nr:hypothetical protein [Candidatus Angelobacter sp.]
ACRRYDDLRSAPAPTGPIADDGGMQPFGAVAALFKGGISTDGYRPVQPAHGFQVESEIPVIMLADRGVTRTHDDLALAPALNARIREAWERMGCIYGLLV